MPFFRPQSAEFVKNNFQLWKSGSAVNYSHAAVFKGNIYAAKNNNQIDRFDSDFKLTQNVATLGGGGQIFTLVATDDYLYAANNGDGIYRTSNGTAWTRVFALAHNFRGGAADGLGNVVFNSITTPFNCYYSTADGDSGTWQTAAVYKTIQNVWNSIYYLPIKKLWFGYYAIGQYRIGASLNDLFTGTLRSAPSGNQMSAIGEINDLIVYCDENGRYYGSNDDGVTFTLIGNVCNVAAGSNALDMITYNDKIYCIDSQGNFVTIDENRELKLLCGSGNANVYGTRIMDFNDQLIALGFISGGVHLRSLNQ